MMNTAIREVKEETGLNFTNLIDENKFKIIMKTKFYIVKIDEKYNNFNDYNKNEIVSIKWFDIGYIKLHPKEFSKQTNILIENL